MSQNGQPKSNNFTVKTDVTEVCIKPSKSPTACCQRVAIKLTRGVNACRLILSVSWRSSSSSCCCPARSASSSSLNLSSCASASPRRIQIYNTMDRWQSCMWCGGVTSGVSQATCSNIYFYEKKLEKMWHSFLNTSNIYPNNRGIRVLSRLLASWARTTKWGSIMSKTPIMTSPPVMSYYYLANQTSLLVTGVCWAQSKVTTSLLYVLSRVWPQAYWLMAAYMSPRCNYHNIATHVITLLITLHKNYNTCAIRAQCNKEMLTGFTRNLLL